MDNLREKVIQNGLCKRARQLTWHVYNEKLPVSATDILLSEGFELDEINLALKINNSWYCKCKRIKDKLFEMQMLHLLCGFKYLFITFTFNDETLSKNNEQSLRTYVRRFLKANTIKYIANVDFGAKNGRIHFHGCCIIDEDLPLNEWYENYGAIKLEHVRVDTDNEKMLSKYINKLSLHAIKDTTGINRIISWRKPKKQLGAV